MTKEDWIEIMALYNQHDWNWTDWTLFVASVTSPIIMLISVIFAAISAKASNESTKLNIESYEQQKQFNKLMIRPDLVIRNKTINLDVTNNTPIHLISWDYQDKDITDNKSFLNLLNVSNNLAKEVFISTEVLNYEEIMRKIKNIEFYESLNIDVRPSKMNCSESVLFVGYNWRTAQHHNRGSKEYKMSKTEEMLVVENYGEANEYLLEIPKAFEVLYNFSFSMNQITIEDMPRLKITIKYSDISDYKYEEKLIVHIKNINIKQRIDENDRVIANFVVNKTK